MTSTRPDTAALLATLKDFQRRTAEYAFRRMYVDDPPARRFLVADEVGLGKTLVARGVIAKTVDYLWERGRAVNIVYVCSNQDIARQNLSRLGIGDNSEQAPASRITMVPLDLVRPDAEPGVSLVAFTPGTSFKLPGSTGMSHERALLAHLLLKVWDDAPSKTLILNVLHGERDRDRFEREDFDRVRRKARKLDPDLLARFAERLAEDGLREQFEKVVGQFSWRRGARRIPKGAKQSRNVLIGRLRLALALVCFDLLEPDLVILDEFQRFPDILNDKTEPGKLAHKLFDYSGRDTQARVLLLSATPYKMYTIGREEEQDDHYRDFMRTTEFLFGRDANHATELRDEIQGFRVSLYRARTSGDTDQLLAHREKIETLLRGVMVRSERLNMCTDPDALISTVPTGPMDLRAVDLQTYLALEQTAERMGQPDMIEFWKSAAYPLNFMTGYRLRKLVDETLDDTERVDELLAILARHPQALLPSKEELSRLAHLEMTNPRVRWLLAHIRETGLDQTPWIPPTLPYYRLAGPFSKLEPARMTKILAFSSWRVVPRSVASLVSYQVRRDLLGGEQALASALKRKQQVLRFSVKQAKGKEQVSGLPLFNWLYPSLTLAAECDPLTVVRARSDSRRLPSEKSVRTDLTAVLSAVIRKASDRYGSADGDPDIWKWAGSVLVDAVRDEERVLTWLTDKRSLDSWKDPDAPRDAALRSAVARLGAVLDGRDAPSLLDDAQAKEIAKEMATVALGSPAVCAARALARISGHAQQTALELMDAAASVAAAMRGLFNQPEIIAMIRRSRGEGRTAYWRQGLAAASAGCLQAVFDEYAHVLRESLGLVDRTGVAVIKAVSAAMHEAISLPSAQLTAQHFPTEKRDGDRLSESHFQCKFSLPFGEYLDQTTEATRTKRLREAFNSPFWPFVLVSTSIGQEGLDFHWYCHAVVHWNLPSNPVDVEQREGRVHRYKGHAIRKNVARRHWTEVLLESPRDRSHLLDDPWEEAFTCAAARRSDRETELVPYWAYPTQPKPEDARIIRLVPHLPLSREATRIGRVHSSLAVYRMVFGQPRQEDLVEYLSGGDGDSCLDAVRQAAMIDLSPPA